MIKKIVLSVIVLILFSTAFLFLWRISLPTEIVAVYKERGAIDIVVKDFPVTDRAKVKWWIKNKTLLQQQYGIPELSREGISSVVIWGFGDGYLKEEPDPDSPFPSDDTDYLFCFAEMKVEARCVRKEDKQMYIDAMQQNRIVFSVDGSKYTLSPGGEIIKKQKRPLS